MRYGGSQQSPEKFIIFHAPTKNDRSHGRFLLSSRAYFDADFGSSLVICFSTNSQQIIIRTLPKLKKAHIIIKNRECVACFSFDQPIAASDNRLSYACILLFPTSTQYPAGGPIFHEFSSSAEKAEYRKLSVFNRVDRFLSGNPKYRYKACEKRRGDTAQKDNSDLANTVT